MDKKVIVSRANEALGNTNVFYKSYAKNVFLVEIREIPEHVMGWVEEDYIFNYKGDVYRLNQHIKPNAQGIVKYSADYYYTLEKLNVLNGNNKVLKSGDIFIKSIDNK